MAARQRLRAAFDARRASQPCWRCALHLPRYSSTSPAGIPNNLKNTEGVPYSQEQQWDVENQFKSKFSNTLPIDMEPVSRSSHESEPGSSQTVHMPPPRFINVPSDSLSTRLQSQSGQAVQKPLIRLVAGVRRVSLDAQSQSQSGQAVQKPRIRLVAGVRLVSLDAQSQSSSVQAVRKPRLRMCQGLPVVVSDTRSPSQSMSAVQQSPTQKPSEGGLVPLGTREVLRFRKISKALKLRTSSADLRIRRLISHGSKHELAPVIALDTRSQSVSAVQQSPTQKPSEGGLVPLGTRRVLRFRKISAALRLRKSSAALRLRKIYAVLRLRRLISHGSKHELDPVIALDTRLPSQSMSAVQQSPTQESSGGGSVPLGTRRVLRFRKISAAVSFRKFKSHGSKHELDPVIALDTRSPSQSMRAVQQSPTRESSGGGSVPLDTREVLPFISKEYAASDYGMIVAKSKKNLGPVIRNGIKRRLLKNTSRRGPLKINLGKKFPVEKDQGDAVGAEAMSPAKRKTNIIDVERLKDFMFEKYGARVRLIEKAIIKRYKVAAKIHGANVHYISNYLNRGRVIRRLLQNFRQKPGILYVAEGGDATRLVRKAGPPLGERPTDAGQVPSKDQHEGEAYHKALTLLLDSFRNLRTSEPPNPTTEIKKSERFPSQHWTVRRFASSRSRTLNRQSLVLKTSFSDRTPRNPKRHFATATSQTFQADAPSGSPIIGTNPDEPFKGKSGGIREALILWQEHHHIALADTSGRPPSTTLGEIQNLFTQSGEDDSFTAITRDDEVEDYDDEEIGSDEPIPDIFTHKVFLRRGDLVELLAASEPILAIFVRNVADQCQFYTIRGEWVHRALRWTRWAVSRFVDPNDLNEILPYLPADEVAEEKMNRLQPIDVHAPRDAGAKIIEKMSLFHQSADAVFREHLDRINRLYEIIAPVKILADPTYMSLGDIAMKVLMKEHPSQLTQPMLWAIHRAIAQCQNIIWDQMSYRQNPIYEILPQQGLEYISQVREWVREYQEGIILHTTNDSIFGLDSTLMAAKTSLNPIATFVKKARVAIEQSRQTRPLSKSGLIGPSSSKLEVDMDETFGKPYREIVMERFDSNERMIIHYLNVWATSSYLNPSTNLAALGPMILRAIGMYEGFEPDTPRGFTLLQELGVITPWENRTVHMLRNLKLPTNKSGGEASRLWLGALRETKAFEPKDAMEGLRKDWGDMPVFCIDSAETLERDDGVSLELVDNDPSAYWVHVHVANPSAFITPDSIVAKYAASLAESVYLPEKRYPMLAPKVTKDHLSLASDRPCITFSAKISVEGDILERKITPGTVRNVHYLTPQMVSLGLGLTETDEDLETVSILSVGGRMPTQPHDDLDPTHAALTEDPGHIKVLHKLLKLGEAARYKRAQSGALEFYSSARTGTTYPVVYLNSDYFEIKHGRVRQFEGDPIITLQRTTESKNLVAKMVSDLMIIAGDIAASWCSDRNIPIPYRGILRNPEPASSPEVFKREVIDPKVAKYGHAGQYDLIRYMRLIGRTQASDRPLEHTSLGLPAYCKVTSPLRRYVDLYTHWQIEAAIRHEAATGSSLVGSTDDSYLPFSRAQVEEYAESTIQRENTLKLAKNSSTRHWICQALFRAFYFQEASLPETFEATVTFGGWRVGHSPGWSNLWSMRVFLKDCAVVEAEGGWRVGDVWEARLDAVDTYRADIYLAPVRLIGREMGAV